MQNPVTPQKGPYKVRIEKGKTYYWCACGGSAPLGLPKPPPAAPPHSLASAAA